MAVTMLLTFFLGLLHLLAGVCDADVVDDDLMNLQAFIYTNPYLNLRDRKVIATLSEQGNCMSYIGLTNATSKGLASCELHCCSEQYNTWDCIAPAIDESNPDWSSIFTDEFLLQWTPGTCSCSNSSNPTPDSVDSEVPDSLTKELAVADATRQVRHVSSYGYELIPDYELFEPVAGWTFWSIMFLNSELEKDPEDILIGVFGVPIDNSNANVLRVSETWASHDKRDPSQRAFMHDTVLGFWRLNPLNRNLDDLKQIRFDGVIEFTITNNVFDAYRLMGADQNGPLTITRSGTSDGEQEAFELILTETKFGRRMQQAIDEYEEFKDRSIEAFYFTEPWVGFDFAIFLDGYDPSTVGGPNWRRRWLPGIANRYPWA